MSSRDVRSPEFIARVRKAVQYFCSGRQTYIPADDLFQSVYLKYLEGGREHSTVEQVIIDVFRDEVGRKGLPSWEKKMALRNAVSYDAVENPDAIMPRAPDARIDEKLDLEWAIKIVDTKFAKFPRLRQAARMLWVEGYLQEEVATYFDVTFSLISQWETKMTKTVRDELQKPQELLTVDEAAEFIGVSFVTLHKAIREKRIRHVLNEQGKRRIRKSDAEAFKAARGETRPVKAPHRAEPIKSGSVPKTEPSTALPAEIRQAPAAGKALPLVARIRDRARELHQAGEYRTSSELLILLLDAA